MKREMKLLGLLVLSTLMSCSAKIEGGGDGGAPSFPPRNDNGGFFDTKPSIKGPVVEGNWVSDCNAVRGSTSYRQWDVTFKNDTIVRVERIFSDPYCEIERSTVPYSGRFRFIDFYSDGAYNIEYAFDMGSGVTTFPQEKILVEDDALYLSNMAIGDVPVLMNEPLYLQESQPASSELADAGN